MKKTLSILSFVLALTVLCGCGSVTPKETTAPSQPLETVETEPPTVPVFEKQDNPVKYFSLSMGENYENIMRMDVYANENGTVHVDYVGEVRKAGDFDANIFHGITEAFRGSGLEALNGKDAYAEGEANGSMYVEFSDGTMVAAGFSGTLPQDYVKGYEAMDAFFRTLTAGLPVYVPQPMVIGEVDQTLLKETLDILQGSGMEALDTFTVTQIQSGFEAGLSSYDGILGGVSVAPMMITTAYSLVLVRLEDTKKAEAVCADFEKNIDWRKWVCVAPNSALIATKGDLALCLVTYEDPGTGTAQGILQAGWTEVKILTNPDTQ